LINPAGLIIFDRGVNMLYRKMPKSGDNLSLLGFGCMRLPTKRGKVDEQKAVELIRYSIDRGVNYADTAWPYHGGQSEVVLGKALKDGYRQKVKVADKLPVWLCRSREDMDHYLGEQFKRVGVDVFDYYLIHSLDGSAWEKAKQCGIMDFLDKAKESGKIVNAGFSFHGARHEFKKIIDEYNWDFCQAQFNILDENDQAGIEGIRYAAAKNIGVIVMEPLRGGTLAGKLPAEVEKVYKTAPKQRSNAEWALRWVMDHKEVVTVLSGMGEKSQAEENIRIAGEAEPCSLAEEELTIVKSAAEIFRKLMKVPCTGCQYCMPCPAGVNIASAFTFYNNKYLFKQGFMNRGMYLVQNGGLMGKTPTLASQCVNCGVCKTRCPQKIDIPVQLLKVKKEFEGFLLKPLTFLLNMMFSAGKRKEK
jgi:uncharacterized protein